MKRYNKKFEENYKDILSELISNYGTKIKLKSVTIANPKHRSAVFAINYSQSIIEIDSTFIEIKTQNSSTRLWISDLISFGKGHDPYHEHTYTLTFKDGTLLDISF